MDSCLQPDWAEREQVLVPRPAVSAFVTELWSIFIRSALLLKTTRFESCVSSQCEGGENSLTRQESPFALNSACNPCDHRQTLTLSAPIPSSSIQLSVTPLLPPATHFSYFHPRNQPTSNLQPAAFCQALLALCEPPLCESDPWAPVVRLWLGCQSASPLITLGKSWCLVFRSKWSAHPVTDKKGNILLETHPWFPKWFINPRFKSQLIVGFVWKVSHSTALHPLLQQLTWTDHRTDRSGP